MPSDKLVKLLAFYGVMSVVCGVVFLASDVRRKAPSYLAPGGFVRLLALTLLGLGGLSLVAALVITIFND